jgi:hypothetical protein
VVLARGTEAQAHAIKDQTAEFMAEQMRLTLSPEKTHVTHVDDAFDLLGFRIKRRPWRAGYGRSPALIPSRSPRRCSFARARGSPPSPTVVLAHRSVRWTPETRSLPSWTLRREVARSE